MTKIIILRGLPGSGKSTFAQKILTDFCNDNPNIATAKIVSADHYFTNEWDEYKFIASELPLAHLQCRYECERALIKKTDLVIVDNCNILTKHFKQYLRMAQYYKYDVEVITVRTAWSNSPDRCYEKCEHGVPLEAIKRMALQFEKFELEE